MFFESGNFNKKHLPERYRCVSIDCLFGNGVVNPAVLIKKANAGGWSFVPAHSSHAAQTYTGCLLDGKGNILDWLDICIQQFGWTNVSREFIGNNNIDHNWQSWAESILQQDETSFSSGFEFKNPSPLFIDLEKQVSILAQDSQGNALSLCRDDKSLKDNSQNPYCEGLDRWLIKGDSKELVCVVDNRGKLIDYRKVLGKLGFEDSSRYLPFNLPCGHILIRKRLPISFEDALRVLDGLEPENQESKSFWNMNLSLSGVSSLENSELYLQGGAEYQKSIEVLHLKLLFIGQMFDSLLVFFESAKKPHLGLDGESWKFDINFSKSFPALWTLSPKLAAVSKSMSSKEIGSALRFYVPLGTKDISLYKPALMDKYASGKLKIRIFDVKEKSGRFQVNGLIEEEADFDSFNAVVLRLQIPLNKPLEFYAKVFKSRKYPGRWELVSESLSLDEDTLSSLSGFSGIQLTGCSYEAWPYTGLACDCYSMALTAMRMFYSLEIDTSEILASFLSLCSRLDNSEGGLRDNILNELRSNPGWLKKLPVKGLDKSLECPILLELWTDIFVVIAKLLPEAVEESVKYSEDILSWNPGKILEPYVNQFKALAKKSRLLIVANWERNNLVRESIRQLELD
ncbi:hypothetical protein [Sedimentisphaera salicampi]|uniref:Uncharacterized protein n=1 Tax=Sedimentisphaera salicampi TaxID=1941349 RepID=A0A1W6LME4_9BACT|nr:hypothetical protein [Sedimentisphaera salicampi]ARN56913.1 hypothetical protein STSP1_01306 [Sedimentisphaera salicampi]